jgi:hypothetical protein
VIPSIAVGMLLLLSTQAEKSAAPPPPARPAAPAPAVAPTFDDLGAAFAKADAAGDARKATSALAEIRRARIERNVESLDTVALGLVGRGVARLDAGQRQEAEEGSGWRSTSRLACRTGTRAWPSPS